MLTKQEPLIKPMKIEEFLNSSFSEKRDYLRKLSAEILYAKVINEPGKLFEVFKYLSSRCLYQRPDVELKLMNELNRKSITRALGRK